MDDKRDCSNYRDLSLLSTTHKILSSIRLSRLTPYAEKCYWGVINVDFYVKGQLLILYYAFVKYMRKNGNKTGQSIRYL